jgi:hypothetical protein
MALRTQSTVAEAERAYLRKRGWTPAEIRLMEANSPAKLELRHLASFRRQRKQSIRVMRRFLRAAETLIATLQASPLTAFNMDGTRVSDPMEAELVERVTFVRARLKEFESEPVLPRALGADRADELRLFATGILLKLRLLLRKGAAAAPHREPGPREMLALYLIAHPQRVERVTEEAMKQAVRRARRSIP